MGKFKVRFKIQALELEIEGDRETVPEISKALENQFSGMLSAPAAVIDTEKVEKNITPPVQAIHVIDSKPSKRRGARTARVAAVGDSNSIAPIDFAHDPGKWGNPKQGWSTLQKSFWLIHILEAQTGTRDLSSHVIAATFNKHFRQAGTIIVGNINRDLGVAKGKSPSPVGEDTSKSPSAWFLTDTGKAMSRKLVEEATGAGAQG